VELVDKRERYRGDEASGNGTQAVRGHWNCAPGPPDQTALGAAYCFDRFLGDFLFKVANSLAAEGGGGTALSKTIA
jgi:hypothetical protein